MRKRKALGVLGLALVGLGIYQFRRQIISRWLGLPPFRYKVNLKRGLKIPSSLGANLAADLYTPAAERLFPTILVRTPYGRGGSEGLFGVFPEFIARRFTERGYNVLVQDVRGRFESEGEFFPFENEQQDGLATLKWIESQPWFNGVLGMWGPSYLGYVQWAIAPHAPLYLKAIMPIFSGSRLPVMSFRDGGLTLDIILRWILELDLLDRMWEQKGWLSLRQMSPRRMARILERASFHLPLGEVDREIVGKPIPFFQVWLEKFSPFDPFWKKVDFGPEVRHTTASVLLMGGWYDILLRETLADYEELCRSKQTPYLTIGPWSHVDPNGMWEALRQGIAWFDAQLKGERSRLRQKPVRIYVMGRGKWLDVDSWPPDARPMTYYLDHAKGENGQLTNALSLELPSVTSTADTYVYDPAHPTPVIGGPLMSVQAGKHDQGRLESRSDVLVYTTPPLVYGVEVIGPVRLVLYVRSSLEFTDFVGRLCDVYPDGRSFNVCEGMLRIDPGKGEKQSDGSLRIEVDLWATAYDFQTGHAIRLQVCSGGHPRWNRNLGTNEPLAVATKMFSAHQTLYHDRDHPSALILPVTNF